MNSVRERREWFLKKYPSLNDIFSHVHTMSLLDVSLVMLIGRDIAEKNKFQIVKAFGKWNGEKA